MRSLAPMRRRCLLVTCATVASTCRRPPRPTCSASLNAAVLPTRPRLPDGYAAPALSVLPLLQPGVSPIWRLWITAKRGRRTRPSTSPIGRVRLSTPRSPPLWSRPTRSPSAWPSVLDSPMPEPLFGTTGTVLARARKRPLTGSVTRQRRPARPFPTALRNSAAPSTRSTDADRGTSGAERREGKKPCSSTRIRSITGRTAEVIGCPGSSGTGVRQGHSAASRWSTPRSGTETVTSPRSRETLCPPPPSTAGPTDESPRSSRRNSVSPGKESD
ncbi:magnesium or manganese-dependent protein phosphatase [Streptomyces viridochromogenes DSM 40736]|uniref:Magnesium or manganese-dependent protein phosphatase n=1 Tax=Streptomyces viridochromogenes (strain DSM 40736 / JCM 4977 / BCRC 1201 / Tue 494) TaxID=591159 RepID=D9X725_STRVT|nr:magnesium or manganese-dependent protein phosphatase [Streptomyces viridochromogenes DSM 40736]